MKNRVGDKVDLKLPDSNIVYFPNFFSEDEAEFYFSVLRKETTWRQDNITVFGKTYAQPRLTALYANNDKPYSYSNITMHPNIFTPILFKIKSIIEANLKEQFSTCLLNLYRNGQDSNGWHADDEKELGENPVIVSVSFGATRFFHLKHKTDKNLKHKMELANGSVLVMKGKTQHFWKHQIPKTARPIGERVNLTFRVIQ